MGKQWISLNGNLFASIFFQLKKNMPKPEEFSLINPIIIKRVLDKYSRIDIKIKWPNDLLFEKLKFCGILQEVFNFDNFDYLIVGIGLNTNIVPKNKSFKSTCLKNILNKKINNQKILKNIIIEYEKFLNEKNRLSYSDLKRKYK